MADAALSAKTVSDREGNSLQKKSLLSVEKAADCGRSNIADMQRKYGTKIRRESGGLSPYSEDTDRAVC